MSKDIQGRQKGGGGLLRTQAAQLCTTSGDCDQVLDPGPYHKGSYSEGFGFDDRQEAHGYSRVAWTVPRQVRLRAPGLVSSHSLISHTLASCHLKQEGRNEWWVPYSPGLWDGQETPTQTWMEPRTCCPGQPGEQLCEHSCKIQVLPQRWRHCSLLE